MEVTAEKVDAFRALSGDLNPLHNDRDFALAHGYEDKVVYGMLTTSLISILTGMRSAIGPMRPCAGCA